jgi:hypothetical protein
VDSFCIAGNGRECQDGFGLTSELLWPGAALEQARRYCQQIGVGYVDACSGLRVEDQACVVILPSDGFDTIAAYRRHEKAHCNGWPPNHAE